MLLYCGYGILIIEHHTLWDVMSVLSGHWEVFRAGYLELLLPGVRQVTWVKPDRCSWKAAPISVQVRSAKFPIAVADFSVFKKIQLPWLLCGLPWFFSIAAFYFPQWKPLSRPMCELMRPVAPVLLPKLETYLRLQLVKKAEPLLPLPLPSQPLLH